MRRHGWAHHIQRLMVLGNWALQHGYDPVELNDWFVDMFVDGTPWVMPANVIGMSQHADGGVVATKPYASGGAYIDRMSDYCGGCVFNPKVRLGENACPFTAGYWAFLDRVEPRIRHNNRMAQPLSGLRRLADREAVVDQERHREVW
jgi:deoxyribodipyrimidine photolyase-related protein